ncbi:glycoside hydrolase family 1 protein [Microbacterium laevaniformans]|uniref:glycoside hydrolase family 1 protein n=1 Tax=Microbacterium laevaniformans TaxID=36807 RepID=UPI0036328C79
MNDSDFPPGFLWGASTSGHQTEGNNIASDWWAQEAAMPDEGRSGDACDSFHRYDEDMRLLAAAGLSSYRFGIEWSRIEPRQGMISRAGLAHYRRMIDTALELGLVPVVTLHHFTSPQWFAQAGGWMHPDAVSWFAAYIETVSTILDGVEWVVTINEPNMLAMMVTIRELLGDPEKAAQWHSPTVENGVAQEMLPLPNERVSDRLIDAHRAAVATLRSRTTAQVGWSVANRALDARPGAEARLEEVRYVWEDRFLEVSRDDDFVGVQSYSAAWVNQLGVEATEPSPDNTLAGVAYRPDALGIAVRHTAEVTGGVPILVTENGIATHDDARRIAYTEEALRHLASSVREGVDVRGYLHWSLLDNYEWGHWGPTFGLIAVDRATFARTPKPSLAWLGEVAARGGSHFRDEGGASGTLIKGATR